MRNRTIFIGLMSTLACCMIFLVGCNNSSIGSMMRASGVPGEVMLVMDGADFSSQAAHDLENLLHRSAPSLPQEESTLSLTSTVAKASFTSMIRRARNIIIVDIDPTTYSTCRMSTTYDEWAKEQLVVRLTSPNLDSVSAYVRTNDELLLNVIVRHELYRLGSNTDEASSHRATELADSLFAHRITVPRDIRHSKVAENFLWMSNAQMRQRRDILMYTFPYHSPRDLDLDRLIEVRDSVLRENIQGEFSGSYPTTVRGGLYIRKVKLPDQPVRSEVRGLWQMEGGAMMGGPFVQHAYHDKSTGKVIVLEGFIYHPNEEKLTLVRTMEAALYSLRPRNAVEYSARSILSASYTPMK